MIITTLKKSSFIWLLTFLSALTSCELKDVEMLGVENVRLDKMSAGKIDGTIDLVLNNPNGFSIKVKSADLTVKSGNVKLGKANLRKSFKIDANESKTYPVEVSGDLQNALAGGLMGLAGMLSGQKPKLTIEGEIKVGNFFFTRKVPISIETNIPLEL
ncbi:MAG: LEA type 2 family protein [Salibacteraceae bacterium]